MPANQRRIHKDEIFDRSCPSQTATSDFSPDDRFILLVPTNRPITTQVKLSPYKVGTLPLLRPLDIPFSDEQFLIDLFSIQQQPWVPSSVRPHEPPPPRSPGRPKTFDPSNRAIEPLSQVN